VPVDDELLPCMPPQSVLASGITTAVEHLNWQMAIRIACSPSGIMDGMTSMLAGIWYGLTTGSVELGCGTPFAGAGPAVGAGCACAKMDPVCPCRGRCAARLVSGS
jgi:hypothetical protein